jgi:two-component system, sensor histidine kinase YesM
MLAYFFTLIALPVFTLGVLGPIMYSRTVAEISAVHTREMVERVTMSLEATIRSQEKTLDMLLDDAGLRAFFNGPIEAEARASAEGELAGLFRAATASHPELSGIIAVAESGDAFSLELRSILRNPLTAEGWYKAARDSERDFSLVTRPIGRNLRNSAGIEPDEIVSLIKAVYREDSGRMAGVLMADLSLEFLEASFKGGSGNGTGFFCILDGKGDFVYAPVNPVVYRINPDWFTNSSRIVEKSILNRGYRFIFTASDYTGWKTIGVYYMEDALRPVRFVQVSALVIALITLALTVTISMVYTNAISKPVIYLQSIMERAGHGDLAVRYDGRSRDEIDELGRGLNVMLEKVEELLRLVYREQQSKREAELRIMQQQIKPHFLYNTLDTILWMAEENAPQQIAEVVTALTKLFRIALSQGREAISIKDEIEHVRSYLVIQKIRYEDKFDFSIRCDESLYALQVQKMILQPLVENAIYHGLKEKQGSGEIRISIELRGAFLELIVEDDGAGIPDAVFETISLGLRHLDHGEDRAAFALYNINDRIRLSYGEGFGISVSSSLGLGTAVTIRHPVVREGGE